MEEPVRARCPRARKRDPQVHIISCVKQQASKIIILKTGKYYDDVPSLHRLVSSSTNLEYCSDSNDFG